MEGSRPKFVRFIAIGACSVVLGVIILLGALISPSVISGSIIDEIEGTVPIKDLERFEDRYGGKKTMRAETYLLFNLTNGKKALSGLEKPRFEVVELKFTNTDKRYDVSFNADKSEVSFTYWDYLEIDPEYADVYNNGMVTVINTQYVGGVYSQFGSESNMFAATADTALNMVVKQQLLDLAAVDAFQTCSIPIFLYTVLMMAPVAGYTAITSLTAPVQWGTSSVLGVDANGSPIMMSGPFEGFELASQSAAKMYLAQMSTPGALNPLQIAYLWNTASPFAVFGLGFNYWRPLVYCVQTSLGAGADPLASCYGSHVVYSDDVVTALTVGGAVTAVDAKLAATAIAAWIVQVKFTDSYRTLSLQAIAQLCVGCAAAATWSDLVAYQFGSGEVVTTVWGQGIPLTLVDFQVYGTLLTETPEISAFAASKSVTLSLTMAQSKAFLATFIDSTAIRDLIGAAQSAEAGDTAPLMTVVQKYADTGLTPTNFPIFVEYLTVFIGKTFFYPLVVAQGTMDDYGVTPSNSGLLTRVTVKEAMEGWVDPVIHQLDPTIKYYGIIGQQYPSVDARKNDTSFDPKWQQSTWKTGVTNIDDVGTYTKRNGLTAYHLRSDLKGGSCTNPYTTMVRKDDCYVWMTEDSVVGKNQGMQFPPVLNTLDSSNYKEVASTQMTKEVFSGVFLRGIPFTKTNVEDVRGVRAERYAMDPLLNDCTAQAAGSTEACNPASAKYYLNHGNNMVPLETSVGGIPGFVSAPYYLDDKYPRQDVRDCFDMSALPGTWTEDLSTYIVVEPMTGLRIKASATLQANLGVYASSLNSGYHAGVFAGSGCSMLYWPSYINSIAGEIDDEQAVIFKDLYNAFDLAQTLMIVGIIVGLVFVFASVPCFFIALGALQPDPAAADANLAQPDVKEAMKPSETSSTQNSVSTEPPPEKIPAEGVAPMPPPEAVPCTDVRLDNAQAAAPADEEDKPGYNIVAL